MRMMDSITYESDVLDTSPPPAAGSSCCQASNECAVTTLPESVLPSTQPAQAAEQRDRPCVPAAEESVAESQASSSAADNDKVQDLSAVTQGSISEAVAAPNAQTPDDNTTPAALAESIHKRPIDATALSSSRDICHSTATAQTPSQEQQEQKDDQTAKQGLPDLPTILTTDDCNTPDDGSLAVSTERTPVTETDVNADSASSVSSSSPVSECSSSVFISTGSSSNSSDVGAETDRRRNSSSTDSSALDSDNAISMYTPKAVSSCAHAECVTVSPCQRMINLSGITTYNSLISEGSGTSSPCHRPLMVLDNACGPSALVTSRILDSLPLELVHEAQLVATDLSARAIAAATRRISDWDWADHVFTMRMDMQHMEGLGDAEFTHVFTNFGITFAKDADCALREMHRILVPGGVCAFTTWKHLPWLEILLKALREELPTSIRAGLPIPSYEDALLSLTNWYAWHIEDFIRDKLLEAGLARKQEPASRSTPSTPVRDEASGNSVEKATEAVEWEDCGSEQRRVSATHTGARDTGSQPSRETSVTPTNQGSPLSQLDSDSYFAQDTANGLVEAARNGYVHVEDLVTTHRYSKHEFVMNFGTAVVDHILTNAWGKDRLIPGSVLETVAASDEAADNDSKEASEQSGVPATPPVAPVKKSSKPMVGKKDVRAAIWRHLMRHYPKETDEITLDLVALVVVARKSQQSIPHVM